MKTKLLVFLFMLALHLPLLAQTKATNLSGSIVGTWKMISQTGTNTDGTSFKMDLAKGKQYKIITPTHWMYVSYDTDSLKGGGDGGTYVLKENKYVETIDDAKTDFIVKVESDKLYQDGAIILPDGKKIGLHEVYQRVAEPAGKNSDIVGTWNMVSGNEIHNGNKTPINDLTELMIITPQHLMWVHKTVTGKFKEALLASYTREGNTITPSGVVASWPLGAEKVKITLGIKGDQMQSHGTVTMENGTKEEFEAIHQNVGKPKLAKAIIK